MAYVPPLTQSPSTCTNVGLFTGNDLFDTPDAEPISLVISGPNFGRNTGTAFSVSSGTLGAALAGSLSGVRGIAISYGHFATAPPTLLPRENVPKLSPEACTEMTAMATHCCTSIVQQLWDRWDSDADVRVYSINVPLAETLRQPTVCWTRVWESRHAKLYAVPQLDSAGAASPAVPPGAATDTTSTHTRGVFLDFKPNVAGALRPGAGVPLEEGTDVWAICNGYIGIARFVAGFTQVDSGSIPPPTLLAN